MPRLANSLRPFRLLVLLALSACATPLQKLPTLPVPQPAAPMPPADLKASESQSVQDFSQKVSDWLKKVEALLKGSGQS